MTTIKFIEKVEKSYESRFDYSKVTHVRVMEEKEYLTSGKTNYCIFQKPDKRYKKGYRNVYYPKIEVVCPKHGEFITNK